MKTITLSWNLPVVRVSGLPLAAEDIEQVAVEISADQGANWAPLNTVLAEDPQELPVPDLEAGDWRFKFVAEDTEGRKSTSTEFVASIADESPPGPVTDISASIS